MNCPNTSQQGNPANEKRVTLAEVRLPNELLRLGVHFADTPGVASSIAANTATTRRFLPEADAAIFVTSFDSPLTEAEVAFLREVHSHIRRIFVVVNKQDLATPQECRSVLSAVGKTLNEVFPEANFRIFSVSARDALHGRKTGSSDELNRSGLPALEGALTDFLRLEKAQELLLRSADRAANLARQLELGIRISDRVRDPAAAAELERKLQEASQTVERERQDVMEAMRARLSPAFRKVCEEQLEVWDRETESRFTCDTQNWFLQSEREIVGLAFSNFLRDLPQRLFSEWVSRNRVQMQDALTRMATGENPLIESLLGQISRIPGDVLGEQYGAQAFEAKAPEPRPLVFREIQIDCTGLEPPWWYDLLPSGERWRHFALEHWRKRAPEFVRRYKAAASDLFATAVSDWVHSIGYQFKVEADHTVSRVAGLIHPEREHVDSQESDNLRNDVQEFMNAVLEMQIRGEGEQLIAACSRSSTTRQENAGACEICTRLEQVIWDFMARRQYELSANAEEQRRHASRSGFCPFHTWQYEVVASPQGVCAAYPAVLKMFAARLRKLADESTSVQTLEHGLSSILPDEESCPACRLAASTERSVARGLARTLARDERGTASLCTLHLRSVLAENPGVNAAQRLAEQEAALLDQLAEDMENYVLKHTARRHHLYTAAEYDAATAGLALLAGSRKVVGRCRLD
jgi:hypothetical protein